VGRPRVSRLCFALTFTIRRLVKGYLREGITRTMESAAPRPTLAKNARMGHPHFVGGKTKQCPEEGWTTLYRSGQAFSKSARSGALPAYLVSTFGNSGVILAALKWPEDESSEGTRSPKINKVFLDKGALKVAGGFRFQPAGAGCGKLRTRTGVGVSEPNATAGKSRTTH